MCTVTIRRAADALLVTMNRDELHERAELGLRSVTEPVPAIYPVDAQAGGSWIAVNGNGLVACLLNRYDHPADPLKVSRGRLVLEVVALGAGDHLEDWARQDLFPQNYNPFTLLVVSPEAAHRIDWDGVELKTVEIPAQSWFMATSTAVDVDSVERHRSMEFRRWLDSGAPFVYRIPAFHLGRDPQDLGRSVFMSREGSHTKSVTQVRVTSTSIDVDYLPESVSHQWPRSEKEELLPDLDAGVQRISVPRVQWGGDS